LPPPGPGSSSKMSAVMLALHERQHLYKLPDTIANGIQNWRCFIGRGGRARLECIDHVTHETFGTVKAEAQSVAAHYQVREHNGTVRNSSVQYSRQYYAIDDRTTVHCMYRKRWWGKWWCAAELVVLLRAVWCAVACWRFLDVLPVPDNGASVPVARVWHGFTRAVTI
jgi:hypothetical protein